MKQFLPYHHLNGRRAIVVDGKYAHGLSLSHWRGENIYPEIADDTSAGIVLNALKANIPDLDLPFVSATHFDIDGFIGVWSLFEPECALQHEEILRELARLGDFRELNTQHPQYETVLKLACYLNSVEKALFYAPYEEKKEVQLCIDKFEYFLKHFREVLLEPDAFFHLYEQEYFEVKRGLEIVKAHKSAFTSYPNLGMMVLELPEPVHYYALFSETIGYDIVLSIYNNERYELEYKYTTWVDITSRPTLPRIEMGELVTELNAMEESSTFWTANTVKDTGPILRLEASRKLTKAAQFAHPTEREIHVSSISNALFKAVVLNFFQAKLNFVKPRKFWTWREINEINHTRKRPNVHFTFDREMYLKRISA